MKKKLQTKRKKKRKISKTELATVLPKFNMKKREKRGKSGDILFPHAFGRRYEERELKNMNLILNANSER